MYVNWDTPGKRTEEQRKMKVKVCTSTWTTGRLVSVIESKGI